MSATCEIIPKACIRCGACATVAPQFFEVKQGPAVVLRQPDASSGLRACRIAATICPTQAIAVRSADVPNDEASGMQRPTSDLYPKVMEVAEGVRWKVADLPWDAFDASKATDPLIAVVREMAYSEQTTFSATQKFMEFFGKDADFSQWVSVWFYEETRHPLILLRWLALAGEHHNDDFVMKGRESEPFMPSRVGTLVINVISEMVAAHAYLHMASGKLEPLLQSMVIKLACDEARHAASFFTYAQALLSQSEQPERDKLDALKVLHFWSNVGANVSHPVNQTMRRLEALLPALGAPPFEPPNVRIAQAIGLLTRLPMQSPADLNDAMMQQTRTVRASR